SPDGERIVTASRDKTARLWQVARDTPDQVMRAQGLAPRCLTAAQRLSFSLPPEPPAWCIENKNGLTRPMRGRIGFARCRRAGTRRFHRRNEDAFVPLLATSRQLVMP